MALEEQLSLPFYEDMLKHEHHARRLRTTGQFAVIGLFVAVYTYAPVIANAFRGQEFDLNQMALGTLGLLVYSAGGAYILETFTPPNVRYSWRKI